MHKIKLGTLAAGYLFKGAMEMFVASGNTFSFLSSVKGTSVDWKQFLYDVVAMVGIRVPCTLIFSDIVTYWPKIGRISIHY